MKNNIKLVDLHTQALQDFDRIQSALQDERRQCVEDRRFYSIAGAQWEQLEAQFANKPRIEINKIHLAVIRIINEYRNNRITVNFISKDNKNADHLADLCSELYRADEQNSVADEAYDNAFEEAVGGGFGAWRLRACYEDEEDPDNDYQRIMIEPIFDADTSVYFDLDAKRQDKADAKYCFVISSMTYDAYKDEYGDDPASWRKDDNTTMYDWCTPDVVYIAEYYKIEETFEFLHVFRGINDEEKRIKGKDLIDEMQADLEAMGYKEVLRKKIKSKKVRKYIMSGQRVLEDCGYIAGKCIPIVPVFGKRWFVDNVERCMGHVRLAKDAQRLKNMQISKLAEYASITSIEKPILLPEQISGYENLWAEDNINNNPYLLINKVTDMNGNIVAMAPQSYIKAPDLPPVLVGLLQASELDIQSILGNPQGGDQIVSNISGKAVELIQNRLDGQTAIYVTNFAKAMKRCGEIWLSMAKDILVEAKRKVQGIDANGETNIFELLKPAMADDGSIIYENNLNEANFSIAVDVGPSSESKKQATVKALTGMLQFMQNDPESAQVLTSMAMMNMEGEGISDIRKYFRDKLIKIGAIEPTKEEEQKMMQAMQNMAPDPNSEFLKASADQAEAEAIKARANTLLTLAKTKETEAKTVETLSNIDLNNREQILKTISGINNGTNLTN